MWPRQTKIKHKFLQTKANFIIKLKILKWKGTLDFLELPSANMSFTWYFHVLSMPNIGQPFAYLIYLEINMFNSLGPSASWRFPKNSYLNGILMKLQTDLRCERLLRIDCKSFRGILHARTYQDLPKVPVFNHLVGPANQIQVVAFQECSHHVRPATGSRLS